MATSITKCQFKSYKKKIKIAVNELLKSYSADISLIYLGERDFRKRVVDCWGERVSIAEVYFLMNYDFMDTKNNGRLSLPEFLNRLEKIAGESVGGCKLRINIYKIPSEKVDIEKIPEDRILYRKPGKAVSMENYPMSD